MAAMASESSHNDESAGYPVHPRLAVGGIVVEDDSILLVLRRNPPAAGEWTIPGGRVHTGETLQAAVQRELKEETGLTVEVRDLAYHFELIDHDAEGAIRFHYVILDYLAIPLGGNLIPGDDVLDARWFAIAKLKQAARQQLLFDRTLSKSSNPDRLKTPEAPRFAHNAIVNTETLRAVAKLWPESD
ncbi:MAG: NUDIX hydrolase [Leptospiraceae bacterium]|nr:NUDIX hydrolase [Leptospiraceae bacterium]